MFSLSQMKFQARQDFCKIFTSAANRTNGILKIMFKYTLTERLSGYDK